MEKIYIKNNKSIYYTDMGKGEALVLVHGYLESKEVWHSFSEKLSEKFRVITLDIPGHGKSDTLATVHTMELMAQCIADLLKHLQIASCTLVGHSMGGYVMLAFAALFPEKLDRLVLFHSSVYADTEEKRKNRLREIEFIEKGKLDLIVDSNLPNTFATSNVERFTRKISDLKTQAKNHDPQGVCALLRGMMERPDRQALIKNFGKPMLFIFGQQDNYIPLEVGKNMVALSSRITAVFLLHSGHMGFIEEETPSVQEIFTFMKTPL